MGLQKPKGQARRLDKIFIPSGVDYAKSQGKPLQCNIFCQVITLQFILFCQVIALHLFYYCQVIPLQNEQEIVTHPATG